MEKTYTKEEVIKLVDMIDDAYRYYTRNNILGSEILDDFLENGFKSPEKEEKTIPFTYASLISKLRWEKFCDITGVDYYATRNGYEIKESEIFYIKESVAKENCLI